FGVLSGFVEGGTLATFTSGGSSTGNQFSTGTVDITNSPASALLTASGLLPGDRVTAPLTVTNGGSLGLTYAVASSVTNADGKGLGAQLVLTVKSGVSDCSNSGFSGGTVLYGPEQPLGNLSSPLNLLGGRSLTSQ